MDPSKLSNFEHKARQLRYRALGKACFEADMPNLLLGHHSGDMEETLIMRLVGGYRGEGLRGIFPETSIPDCEGIYGAYLSGGRSLVRDETAVPDDSPIATRGKEYQKPGFEYGGVKLYRPLLGFSKHDLRAVLEEYGVPSVEDSTNADPTVSRRNTIRHLVQQQLLPKAFVTGEGQDSSVLKTRAETTLVNYFRRNAYADVLFQACQIESFDARTGCLHVRLPLHAAIAHLVERHPQSIKTKEARSAEEEYIAARLIRQLLHIVTPLSAISLQHLRYGTLTMFPDLALGRGVANYRPPEGDDIVPPFTTGRALCTRVSSPIVSQLHSALETDILQDLLDPDYVWRFERQPYARQELLKCHFGYARAYDTFTEQDWQLWDGRYWIRILNPKAENVTVRPLERRDMAQLRRRLYVQNKDRAWGILQGTLEKCAPGDRRYTLPVIADEDDGVLALPTFGLGLVTRDHWARGLRYETRYKQVVLPDGVRDEVVTSLPESNVGGPRRRG